MRGADAAPDSSRMRNRRRKCRHESVRIANLACLFDDSVVTVHVTVSAAHINTRT